jgi:hypothetical protein
MSDRTPTVGMDRKPAAILSVNVKGYSCLVGVEIGKSRKQETPNSSTLVSCGGEFLC